ncbi:MAG: hypothetical protein CUN57_01295, partial [Phototrophicales bacterium]
RIESRVITLKGIMQTIKRWYAVINMAIATDFGAGHNTGYKSVMCLFKVVYGFPLMTFGTINVRMYILPKYFGVDPNALPRLHRSHRTTSARTR